MARDGEAVEDTPPLAVGGGKGEQGGGNDGVVGVCRRDGKCVGVAQRQRQVPQHQCQLVHCLVVAEKEVVAQRRPAPTLLHQTLASQLMSNQ